MNGIDLDSLIELGAVAVVLIAAGVLAALWISTYLGVRAAGVRGVTFGKTLLAGIGVSVLFVVALIASEVVPLVGLVAGLVLWLVLSVFVIQGVFSTNFGKAVLAWVVSLVLLVVIVVVAVFALRTL